MGERADVGRALRACLPAWSDEAIPYFTRWPTNLVNTPGLPRFPRCAREPRNDKKGGNKPRSYDDQGGGEPVLTSRRGFRSPG